MITVFTLQITAMITMLADHLGGSFFHNMTLMRCIGRFAFPIYALLLADGYRHMKNNKDKVMKHLGSYIVLALISEVAYDLLECHTFTVDEIMSSQNCIFTLLLAFLGLMAIDYWKEKPIYAGAVMILTAFINYGFKSNYKFVGVLLVYAFYFYLNRMEKMNYFKRFAALLFIFILYIPMYHWARYDFCSASGYIDALKGGNTWWYLTHILIAAFLAGYTGKLGFYSPKFKKIYKVFYPAHLLILGLISVVF